MRRTARSLLILVAATACGRSVTSAPVTAPQPSVVLAGAPAPLRRTAPRVSSVEEVDYILQRGLEIPVAGMTMRDLHDTFDEGRDDSRTHRAMDILAPRGTAVVAADSGRLIRIGFNALGGNTIYASDPQGRVVYYYAHLDAYQPRLVAGAAIARGDTLGFVGTTGNAPKDTPHLHFQVMRMSPDGRYWDGEPINPYPLFLLLNTARP